MQTIEKREDGKRKRRFSPLLWLSCLGSVAILALGISGTLGQFVAGITNSQNHVQTGSFGFSESNTDALGNPISPPCASAGAGQTVTCADINKNGDLGATATPISPGQSRTTTVHMQNTAAAGGISGQLTLTPQACTQAPPVGAGPPVVGDLCANTTITIHCGSTPAFDLGPVTLTAFFTGTPVGGYVIAPNAPPQATVDCTFTTALPAAASAVPGLGGITTSQPMTWNFTQV